MSPVAEDILQRIDAARQQWWLFTLLTTCVLACNASLGLFLIFMLCDVLLAVARGQGGRLELGIMFAIWMTVNVLLIAAVARRSARSHRSLDATARRIESGYPELHSSLINLVQLADAADNNAEGSSARLFCDAAVNRAATDIGPLRLDGVSALQSRWGRFVHCMQTLRDLVESSLVLGLLLATAVFCQLSIPNWGSAANRIITPWEFVPSVGLVEITLITPEDGHTQVMMGSALEITAEIRTPHPHLPSVRLFVTPEGEAETELPMALLKETVTDETSDAVSPDAVSPDAVQTERRRARYTLTIPAVLKPLTYRLEAGDSGTPIYRVGVHKKPTVEEVEVTYAFPAYLHREKHTSTRKHADLEAPQGTTALLRIRTSAPIAEQPSRPYLLLGGQRFYGRIEQEGRLMVAEMPMLEDGVFTIHLFNEAGHADPDPRLNRIRVLLDGSPTVQLLKPRLQSKAEPASVVPIMIRATDDHGLGRLRLEMKVAAGDAGNPQTSDAPVTRLEEWNDLAGETATLRHFRLTLDPETLQPGAVVQLRAVARDRRSITQRRFSLKPQETVGPWHTIRIVSKEARSADVLAQLDGLRAAIWKILDRQLRARVASATLLHADALSKPPSERAVAVGKVRSQQLAVRTASLDLLELFATPGRTDGEERLTIKRVVNNLVMGDMLEAVRLCDTMTETAEQAAASTHATGQASRLTATQERIVKTLRGLLDMARRMQSEVLADREERPGGDLPDDSRQVLEEARDKLIEFIERQKKVIEASEELAKIPVEDFREDFREEQEQEFKQLAAIEDDWSRFIGELQSDLSKLPEQDFANPSALDDLVTIDTDLKMARDALLKKAVDVAVPLEQLGAEMAEEIVTNLEKWLPDTPDRARWSQEESLTDRDKEAPMAELPSQLEDLIGELLEEEEDLFDEMEDISSSATASLDKGAGWAVKDGTISNMSAKGATGNRLPNSNEIGGRSGEGRSGKASGEFVGNEAVGKGGRKTPSRLTPDPLVKGQIKDRSTDPTGGSTGGGKESGEGAEGLEGPTIDRIATREMQRLAGRQAVLRNKAESIDLQFQIMQFHHTDLQKLIAAMGQVERDLRSGHSGNALRRRQVLVDGLDNVRRYLRGEFEVRRDTTSNLPTDIQKELLGSMRDPSPPGWEEHNRHYFQRLSGSAATNRTETDANRSMP